MKKAITGTKQILGYGPGSAEKNKPLIVRAIGGFFMAILVPGHG